MDLLAYLRESREELKKVTWPTRPEVTRLTVVVFLVSLVTAVYLSVLDSLLVKLIQLFLKVKK